MLEMLVVATGVSVLTALATLIGTLSKAHSLDDGRHRLALARRGLGERVRLLDQRELDIVERERFADIREARLDHRERAIDRRERHHGDPRV